MNDLRYLQIKFVSLYPANHYILYIKHALFNNSLYQKSINCINNSSYVSQGF